MAKRSAGKYARNKHDAYDTPRHAIEPLLPHLAPRTRFIEPCVGSGRIVGFLQDAGHVFVGGLDVSPRFQVEDGPFRVAQGDATKLDLGDPRQARKYRFGPADQFITNPPWTAALMHEIILNLYWQRPTWILTSADWKHTRQAGPYMPLCRRIVSVGRVRWMEGMEGDQGHTGKDNCAWYLFAPPPSGAEFFGRQ